MSGRFRPPSDMAMVFCSRMCPVQLRDQFQAFGVGHDQVGHDQTEGGGLIQFQCLLAVAGPDHLVAQHVQESPD
jgi:hypothetical protein